MGKKKDCNGNGFKCNNEDRESELEMLPIEIQAQIWASMRRTAQLRENAQAIVGDFVKWDKFMDELEDFAWEANPDDRAKILALLFIAAEYFEASKIPVDTPPGEMPFHLERAREFDWMRHVFVSRPKFFLHAVRVIRHIPNFGHDPADARPFVDDKEFQPIYDYWKSLNE